MRLSSMTRHHVHSCTSSINVAKIISGTGWNMYMQGTLNELAFSLFIIRQRSQVSATSGAYTPSRQSEDEALSACSHTISFTQAYFNEEIPEGISSFSHNVVIPLLLINPRLWNNEPCVIQWLESKQLFCNYIGSRV